MHWKYEAFTRRSKVIIQNVIEVGWEAKKQNLYRSCEAMGLESILNHPALLSLT